jgi:hypothetical protein
MKKNARVAAVLCAGILTPMALGQVVDYSLYYLSFSAQTDRDGTVVPLSFVLSSGLSTVGVDDISAAVMNMPEGNFFSYSGSESSYTFLSGGDESLILSAFPPGEYFPCVSGGTLGDLCGDTITVPAPTLSDIQPVITPETFDALASYDTASDFIVSFTPFSIQPGAQFAITFLYMINDNTGQLDVIYFDDAPVAEFNIPAGTLVPGTPYRLALYHSSRHYPAVTNFGTPLVAFDRNITIPFVTLDAAAPCVADFNQDGGVDGLDVEVFFEAWVNADASADTNQDGGVDGTDVEIFFEQWSNGGC